jgi:EAL domain-containing protein (putative c-di-GMP-specific phosphodiesterase class I)
VDEEAEIRLAMGSGQIVPWYQPEVDLLTGEILGAEMLARWIHPQRGVLSAASFVPIIEEAGMLAELGRINAYGAIEAAKALRGRVGETFHLRFNVSASQLARPEDLTGYLSMIKRRGIDPAAISFEVTETAIINDLPAARAWLDRARSEGIRISLDDFGTGYSSLSLLAQLPLDGVKIDISFVRELTTNPGARAVVVATIEMARELNLEVVAEGVENEVQAESLRALGVRRAQGYLYSPAVPFATLNGWIGGDPPWSTAASTAVASR